VRRPGFRPAEAGAVNKSRGTVISDSFQTRGLGL